MIERLLQFAKLTHDFNQIKRKIFATGEDRWETDSEHSFQLAMVGWFLVESEGLALRKDMVIKLALVHDLVEVFAGDVYAYDSDQGIHQSKKENEKLAAEKLQSIFPDFLEMHKLILEYEALSSEEAKFVYALDKLLPEINNYLDGGKSWKYFKISLDQIQHKRIVQVKENSSLILSYLKELLYFVEKDRQTFFGD